MMDADEIRWLKATANELNNLLQVMSESSQFLEGMEKGSAESVRYFAILRGSLDRAGKVARMLIDRASGTMEEPAPPPMRIMEAPAFTPAKAGADVSIANPTGARELVMLVDDEDFVTMLAARVLTDEGYRVVTARDGFQALDLYRKLGEQIALVILDFTMPVMDGADVFEELLDLNPKVSVVLSSGFAEQDRLRAMLAKGLRGFIPKPYTQQKLLTQIRATLDAIGTERPGRRVA